MKHTLLHIHRSLVVTLTLLLLFVALILTAARFITPFLANQRPLLEKVVSLYLSQPVKIGSLKASWEGFTPVLRSSNVIIYNDAKTHALLEVNNMALKINLLQSFLNNRFELGKIIISGAELTAHQTADNKIIITGLSSQQDSADNIDTFLEWLLVAPQLSFQNINLNFFDKNNHLIPITNLIINLHNSGAKHSLWGQGDIDTPSKSQIRFITNAYGNWLDKNFYANFYLAANNLWLGHLSNYSFKNYTFKNGMTDFQIWGQLQNQNLKFIQSLFNVNHLEIAPLNSDPHLIIDHAGGNVLWQNNNTEWDLSAALKDLTCQTWKKIPCFSHLNAYFETTPQTGHGKFWGDNISADFGTLFAKPLALTKLDSTVTWQLLPEGWLINSDNSEIATEDSDAIGNLSLLVPNDGSSPVISLLASLQTLGKKHLADDLPIGILSPGLVEWLEQSILNVKKTDATLVLRGPLRNFPFDQNDGVFLVDANVEGLDLQYLPNWPTVKNINGELVFKNRSMEMLIDQAQILQTPLRNVQAQIPVIEKNVLAMLNIHANVATDLSQILQFLKESPLGGDGLPGLKDTTGKGPVQLQLALGIPLEHTPVETTINGHLVLQNAELTTHTLPFTNLTGVVDFTRHTAVSNLITANLWNTPVKINISSPQNQMQIGFIYKDLKGNLSSFDSGWNLNLNSNDLNGQIRISNDPQIPIEARFTNLILESGATDNISSLKPSDIPKLHLTADNVQYGNKQLGKLELQLQPNPSGLQITNLRITHNNYSVAANGYWQLQGDREYTKIVGNLTSNDLATMLVNLDFPSAVAAKSTQIHFDLSWPGAAYDPDLSTLEGTVALEIQQGQITNIGSQAEMKMNIGRLLSLLSVESLTRRLKLDFSDVTDRGLPFDVIRGNLQLAKGNAYTVNTVVKGPIADLGIAGRIGLVAEDYDLMFNVTPKISGSLPTLVGIAASPIAPVAALAFGPVGPAVGAAAWVASKFVGGAVNKIATDTYHMTGSWGNPNVKQVGNFFTKTPKK